jgi:hypothetical protein
MTSSIETALNLSESFCLEFCARERSLPYAKMIHGNIKFTFVLYKKSHFYYYLTI